MQDPSKRVDIFLFKVKRAEISCLLWVLFYLKVHHCSTWLHYDLGARHQKIASPLTSLKRSCLTANFVYRFHLPEGERTEEEIEQTAVEKQIDQSWETLQKKINIGDEYISNVRVAADCREVRRRKELIAEQKRQSSKLESEANAAEDMFQKVSANWHMLSISTDPLHIDNGLQQQKIKCDELLKRKNDLIDALDNELKFKDVKYAKEERLMKEDLRSMVDRIDKQVIIKETLYDPYLTSQL